VDVVLVEVVDIDDVVLVIRFMAMDEIIPAKSLAYVGCATKRTNDERDRAVCPTD
jgi:hypothetical protein